MIKANHQIDAGLCGFINKATIVGRAKLQTIPRLHLMAGIAFDKHQLALLQELGCHHIQGFLFSRPLAPNELALFSLA